MWLLVVGLASQTACIKSSMNQLASPASLHDMHTILDSIDLGGELGAIVQQVLDIGRTNLDDDAWDAKLQEAAIAVVADAMPTIRMRLPDLSVQVQGRMVADVRDTLRRLAEVPGPHDPSQTSVELAESLVGSLGTRIAEADREALVVELTRSGTEALGVVVDGPDPFTRLLARNLALGFLDGIETFDPAPLHRFLAQERAAFVDGTQESLRWWKASFWIASAAAGLGMIALSLQLYRSVQIRSRNTRTLRLLAGVLKSRESDPSLRELLTTIADPNDPDAARNLSDFYNEHPDLRLNLRTDPTRHPVAPQENS